MADPAVTFFVALVIGGALALASVVVAAYVTWRRR